MPPRPFVNDALWRCLCPGFPPNTQSPTSFLAGVNATRRNVLTRNSIFRCSRHHLRAYSTPIAPFGFRDAVFSQQDSSAPSFGPFGSSYSRNGRDKSSFAQMSTALLYDHLRIEGARGNWEAVMSICRVLVKDRNEQLNKEMYTAMLHSFVSASNGTGGKVRKVLEEMGFWNEMSTLRSGQTKIELDARGCECVLEVLAVHPDYLLRDDILEYMKSRWFTLSDRGQNFVVAGMLRERHFEHALETMDEMANKNARIEGWLFDKAIWTLLEFGEIEEAFYVLGLKERVQGKSGTGTATLSEALWASLLDVASQKQLLEPSKMIWTTQVQPGYLKPATGTCLSVLMLASRYGDVQLATDVFRVLTERQVIFTTHHYELLIATYLKANDLSAALSVILIMFDAKLKVDADTCQPIFWYLAKEEYGQESRPIEAFALLQEFEASGRKVPTPAVNACIQASVALNRLGEAIEIYKALHTVSQAGPNTQTFNILFKGCSKAGRKELAMFLANEMVQLGLKPDRITYDRLLIICTLSEDLADAFLYYEEMKASGMQPRPFTWETLILKCVALNDERAVVLSKEYKANVNDPRRHVEKAVLERFEYHEVPAGEQA